MARRAYSIKQCAYCGADFEPTTGSAKYCPEHSTGSWERNNPDVAAALLRRRRIRYAHKQEFGDVDTYPVCVEKYGETCGICAVGPQATFHLAVDRDHATDEIRGLLCARHNTGLGYFQDDPALLRAGADYLENSPRLDLAIVVRDVVKRERVGLGTKLINGKRVPVEDVDPAVLAELAAAKLERQRESKRAYKARQRAARDGEAS